MSALDITAISLGIWVTGGFDNHFFVLYYPAVAAFAIVSTSSRVGLLGVTAVAIVYTLISIFVEEGVSFVEKEEKVLLIRIVTMYAMVGVVNFIFRMERTRLKEAVEAERIVHEENVVLERRAVDAEQTLQLERIRISEEIHNGAAQSAYVISLGLETCNNLVKDKTDPLSTRLTAIHAVAKQAIWELRYPINLGPVFEGKDLEQVLEIHVDNFQTISSIPTTFEVAGPKRDLPILTTQRLFSIAHNAMTNAYRHADASSVDVRLAYQDGTASISIADDGVGLPDQDLETVAGHGIRNIRRTAEEMGGTATIDSAPGRGTTVSCTVPVPNVRKEAA